MAPQPCKRMRKLRRSGASRRRLVTMFLAEGLIPGLGAGAVGVGVAVLAFLATCAVQWHGLMGTARLATTGKPVVRASMTTRGLPSPYDGRTKTSAFS